MAFIKTLASFIAIGQPNIINNSIIVKNNRILLKANYNLVKT